MMPVPQRRPDLAPEARPAPNLIELNTIKREVRRSPYVFPDEAAEVDGGPGNVHLFDFLTSAKPDVAVRERPKGDPWARLSERMEQAVDPEDVSTLLADLLTRLDTLTERSRKRRSRLVPAGAVVLPPLCIASALVAANLLFMALSRTQVLALLAPWAPWAAALIAVPTGLTTASLLLGWTLGQVQPGEGLRFGDLRGRVLASHPHEWLVQFENLSLRRIPYYLAVFTNAERLGEGEEHA